MQAHLRTALSGIDTTRRQLETGKPDANVKALVETGAVVARPLDEKEGAGKSFVQVGGSERGLPGAPVENAHTAFHTRLPDASRVHVGAPVTRAPNSPFVNPLPMRVTNYSETVKNPAGESRKLTYDVVSLGFQRTRNMLPEGAAETILNTRPSADADIARFREGVSSGAVNVDWEARRTISTAGTVGRYFSAGLTEHGYVGEEHVRGHAEYRTYDSRTGAQVALKDVVGDERAQAVMLEAFKQIPKLDNLAARNEWGLRPNGGDRNSLRAFLDHAGSSFALFLDDKKPKVAIGLPKQGSPEMMEIVVELPRDHDSLKELGIRNELAERSLRDAFEPHQGMTPEGAKRTLDTWADRYFGPVDEMSRQDKSDAVSTLDRVVFSAPMPLRELFNAKWNEILKPGE